MSFAQWWVLDLTSETLGKKFNHEFNAWAWTTDTPLCERVWV